MPEEIAVAITAAAISISKKLPAEDTVLLGTAFTQLGDTLATLAAAKERLEAITKAQADNPKEQDDQSE